MKTSTLLIAILVAVGLNTSYAQNTWEKKADFGGLKRNGAVGFSIGSKGYLGTGYGTGYYKDFWEYDPATNAWTQKADFGGDPRSGAVGFSIGNKGYLGTGNYKRDFWEYDPSTNAWTQKADFGIGGRDLAVGFSIGNKGYLGTGEWGGTENKDFWEYDPATNVWTQKADFGGPPVKEAVGFSIGSKGYIGTGIDVGGHDHNDFWEYDPAINAWKQRAKFGGGLRYLAVGFSIGNKGYLGTGIGSGVGKEDFWEYNPSTNAWTQKADFGGGIRYFAVGFSVGSKGYVGTGFDGSLFNDFWEYTPDNACPAPAGMKVQDISDTAAILKWHVAGADILHVRVRYRVVGGTAWAIKNKNGANPTIHIDGLLPNTTYQWQLRSFCAQDTSGWVAGPDFTTTASFASSLATSAITSSKLAGNTHLQIMPNPNKGNFTIQLQLPAKAAITTLSLYNNRGEKIWQQDAGKISGAVRKNISLQDQLPAGIYMMVVQRNDVRLEQKIVINK